MVICVRVLCVKFNYAGSDDCQLYVDINVYDCYYMYII